MGFAFLFTKIIPAGLHSRPLGADAIEGRICFSNRCTQLLQSGSVLISATDQDIPLQEITRHLTDPRQNALHGTPIDRLGVHGHGQRCTSADATKSHSPETPGARSSSAVKRLLGLFSQASFIPKCRSFTVPSPSGEFGFSVDSQGFINQSISSLSLALKRLFRAMPPPHSAR